MLLLTKIFSLLVYPLSLGVLFLVLALVGQLRGNRGAAAIWSFVALALLYGTSTEYGANALMRPLEARYPAFAPEELPKADMVVLLGGAIEGESLFGRGGDLNQAADRMVTAVELYNRGLAPGIVISGGARVGLRDEAGLMAEKLALLGVPQTALTLESQSRDTYQNAINTAGMLKDMGREHILLVTSGAHMRRAVAVFKAQGLKVTAVATDHQIPRHPPLVPGWLPTVQRLERSTLAIHEWVGMWFYDLTGRL